MRDVRLYVEGGGDGAETKATLRIAFSDFLAPIRDHFRARAHWNVIVCGGRSQTYEKFCDGLRHYPEALNLLLVDSENRLATGMRWNHVAQRTGDAWAKPPEATEESLHFMVVVMETWFLADVETMQMFYGKGFKAASLPKHNDLEQIAKRNIEVGLRAATRRTAAGEYKKIKHGAAILKKLNSAKVRAKATHCEKLFRCLATELGVIA